MDDKTRSDIRSLRVSIKGLRTERTLQNQRIAALEEQIRILQREVWMKIRARRNYPTTERPVRY